MPPHISKLIFSIFAVVVVVVVADAVAPDVFVADAAAPDVVVATAFVVVAAVFMFVAYDWR